jgi:23S rRNA (uracil1939-C5)-methyltransferase
MPTASLDDMPSGTVVIESLDQEGRGVAHIEGKTLFVEGALTGECVTYSSHCIKKRFELARLEQIIKPSNQRVMPLCAHYGLCGGCVMQHVEPQSQAAVKQRVLEDALWHIARLRARILWPPIWGETWAYRTRARLSVRRVERKGGVLVGFHEKRSSYIADMRECRVLSSQVSLLLEPLKAMLTGLSIAARIPQVEVAQDDTQVALVLRVLDSPSARDQEALRGFAQAHDVVLYLQPAGPDSAVLFYPDNAQPLSYVLPDFNVRFHFAPTEFTQVNPGVNRMLVRRAIQLLAPRRGERIADLFCGLGNFSLPMARYGAHVVGIEGSAALVQRAQENARLNALDNLCTFSSANLFRADEARLRPWGHFDKLLLDPPREGALAVVKALEDDAPSRLVYISCNPATLARDAAVLVHEKGYVLEGMGIAAMFPHTAHVESLALFVR